MTTADRAETSLKASAWALAAATDKRTAVEALKRTAREIEASDWKGPTNER